MPWTSVRLPADDEETEAKLVRAFRRAHQKAGAPPDAAIFKEKSGADVSVLIFPPASVNLAAAAMTEIGLRGGPVAIVKPERVDQQIFGAADARQRLLGR
jgi:hypothetical protein